MKNSNVPKYRLLGIERGGKSSNEDGRVKCRNVAVA